MAPRAVDGAAPNDPGAAPVSGSEEHPGVAESSRMLAALAGAWSTFTLYPNPVNQLAFVRAIETLATFEGSALMLDIGPGSFRVRGAEIDTGREGADRLATQLYLHESGTLRMGRAPSGDELVKFFEVVSREPAEIVEHGGIEHALRAAGVEALTLERRTLLGELPEGDDTLDPSEARIGTDADAIEGGRSELAAKVERGSPPEEVASDLLATADGDPQLAAKHFLGAFTELYQGDATAPGQMQQIGDMLLPYVSDDDVTPPIVTFVETFFCLPGEVQTRVLELFLDSIDDGVHRLFVDQLSGDELSALATQLGEDHGAALLEYARDTLDREDAELEDLLPPLRSAREISEHRRTASDRIVAALAELDGGVDVAAPVFAELRGELARVDHPDLGWDVLRGLLGCEYRPHRFRRVLRIWTGRIGAAIRDGDLKTALYGVRVVEDDPPYQPEERSTVEEALGGLVTSDLLGAMWNRTTDDGDATLLELVTSLGPVVIDRLIEQLAAEENAGRRKLLVEMLGSMAARNLRHVVKRLEDERWYVVRNLATVLGRSGRKDAVPPLKGLMAHADYRVRVEALRALVPLEGRDATALLLDALQDGNERIRQAALPYLRSGDHDVGQIADAVTAGHFDGDIVVALIDVLATKKTPEAVGALEDLAGRRFAVRSADRTTRQAAKEALERLRR